MLLICLSAVEDPHDKIEFEEVYEKYKKQMWYAANAILGDAYLSEDAVHEAFIGIARNFSKVKTLDPTAMRAYVITASANSARNMLKKSKFRQEADIEQLFDLRDEKADSELNEIETKDLANRIIAEMPEKYTDVMYLRFVLNLGEKEIAEQLGRNINTVRQQISRGRKLFISIMSKGGREK